jgi:hypothetical protein
MTPASNATEHSSHLEGRLTFSSTVASVPVSTNPGNRSEAPADTVGECSIDANGILTRRFFTCLRGIETYTLTNVVDGVPTTPVGGISFLVTQQVDLAANSTSWSEEDTLTIENGSRWGIMEGPLSILSWTAECSSACTATDPEPFPPGSLLTEGESLTGGRTFEDPQQKGSSDTTTISYELSMEALAVPTVNGPSNVGYSFPDVRCDNSVGSNAGCVFPSFTPTFNVNAATFPLAAEGVRWAQNNLATHPGTEGAGEPLHRQATVSKQRANRRKVCNTGWVTDPAVTDDSCDEYPFAATQEGGSMVGTSCAEIVPNDDGTVTVAQAAGASTCSRAHVPLSQNTDVGGDLGRFVQDQRVLDGDPYWVSTN